MVQRGQEHLPRRRRGRRVEGRDKGMAAGGRAGGATEEGIEGGGTEWGGGAGCNTVCTYNSIYTKRGYVPACLECYRVPCVCASFACVVIW